jgi:hypothetical protein
MPPAIVEAAGRRLGSLLRALDVPRQDGLFPNGCSVCGATEVLAGLHHGVYDVYPLGRQEEYVPVRWTCHVCERLVCPRCTLERNDTSGREFYFHTYCCEACRRAAPLEFMQDDQDMR